METGGVELVPTTWAKDLEVEVGEGEREEIEMFAIDFSLWDLLSNT